MLRLLNKHPRSIGLLILGAIAVGWVEQQAISISRSDQITLVLIVLLTIFVSMAMVVTYPDLDQILHPPSKPSLENIKS